SRRDRAAAPGPASCRGRGRARALAREALLDDAVLGQVRAAKLGDDLAVAEDEHAVAEVREVLVLDARDDDGPAGLGDVADPREDLLLRTDVDALRRLVQE